MTCSRDFGFLIGVGWCVVRKMRRVMKAKLRAAGSSRLALSRFVMLVTLIAFSVQTYLTQTHIHIASESRSALTLETVADMTKALTGAPAAPKDKYPPNEDPANCPLCQELIHSGQFVTPAAAAILLPSLSVSVIDLVASVPTLTRAVTHIWRGRAPPLG